jgi:hypothetical protein
LYCCHINEFARSWSFLVDLSWVRLMQRSLWSFVLQKHLTALVSPRCSEAFMLPTCGFWRPDGDCKMSASQALDGKLFNVSLPGTPFVVLLFPLSIQLWLCSVSFLLLV